MCPACLSNNGCRRTALGERPECAAASTSQTFLWPVDVFYMLDNTYIKTLDSADTNSRKMAILLMNSLIKNLTRGHVLPESPLS